MKPGASAPAADPSVQNGFNPAQRLLGRAHGPVVVGLQAMLVGGAYAVLSVPAAYTTSTSTLAAIIWPASALVAALLWREPYRHWPAFLLCVFLAMLWVGSLDELSLGADVAFAVLDVFQVALYSWTGRRFISERGEIDTSRKLARFMLVLPLLCTGVVAALGATIGVLTKQTLWLDEWRVMMVGNGLAVLVLLPALLAWCPPGHTMQAADAPENDWRTPTTAVALVAVVLGSATLVQSFPAELLRALLSLVLVWAAIHGGLRAAASGMLVAAITGIGLTWYDLGPYASALRYNGVWELQIDLAGLAVLSFFVAIAVNERQKLNLRLDRARRFESMGLLAGGIAHDFNNILGAVGGYAELAREQLRAGGTARGSLQEVTLAVSRGKALTEQILQAGKPGKRPGLLVDFRDVVLQAALLARPLLPAGVHMTLSVPTTPVPAAVDEAQLVRALLNLMRNASQAASNEVTVTLNLSQLNGVTVAGADHVVGETPDDACLWTDITNDGGGIPAAHIHQLFEPFFSARAAGRGQGTGLGLAIVAGVATDHAGGVAVWSGHGAATRFRLMLPLAAGEVPCNPAAPGEGQPVLLLQPDAALRERHEEALAALGFEPAGYSSDAKLLAALAKSTDVCVLVVIGAPATGEQHDVLLEKIHRLAPAVAVIVCAADAEPACITQTAHCVTMPSAFDNAVLDKAVTMAIGAACHPAAHAPIANQSL